MGIQVFCSKGCGVPITIDDETIEEAKALGAPLQVAHEVCPRDQKIYPLYRVTISVEKLTPITGIEAATIRKEFDNEKAQGYEAPELLTTIGDTVEAPTFADAFDSITKSINKQWESVSKVRTVIEQ